MNIDLLHIMIRIRLFEEKISEYKSKGILKGPVHSCIGQEAVSAGVCSALDKNDYVIGNHRSHGHIIARGTDLKRLVHQIFYDTGSMHVNDPSIGFIISTAIVGSGLSLACGMAFASKFKKEKRIVCVFFGDGAVNEGTFHECMNIASMWKLPVLFVLENNHVAVTTVNTSHINLEKFTSAYGVGYCMVDGQDVVKVNMATNDAIKYVRENNPFLLEVMTHRFHEHQEGPAYERMKETGYRNEIEEQDYRENFDPINRYDYTDIIQQEREIVEDAFKTIE
jgi:acetoin:2,6-dichlorophenolindophenol oxidoreductase subunit alpha